VLLLALLQGTSLAQQPDPDVPPEKAKQFLELLSEPELKAWLEGKIPAAEDGPDLKKAFAENGIKIAYPTVHVEGGGGTEAAAHQAYETLKKSKAPLEVVRDTP
jgi:hypothetical protein